MMRFCKVGTIVTMYNHLWRPKTIWTPKFFDEDKIKFLMKYFNKKLLPLFMNWKEINQKQMDPDNFTLIYVKNMKRVLATNFEKKNKNAMLQNKLYKYLKINLKNFIENDIL